MAQPTVRVRIGFSPNTFTLDDLARGILDTNELGGAVVLTDVTSDVQSITINRGRSKDLESFFTGSCTVRLLNNARKYENTNTSSPYYPGIEPLIQINVDATTDGGSTYEDLFVGFVTDINLSYPDPSNSFADFLASDAFMKIANTEILNQAFASTDSGTMVENVLDTTEVKFSAGSRDIETGISTMQSISDLSGNTLSILQQIERSENGLLFVSKSGNVTFRSRHTTYPSSPQAIFSDDGNDISYLSVEYINDDNEIYNVINLQRNGGSVQTVEDVASQSKYLVRSLTRDQLFNNSDTEVLNAANFLLNKYSSALIRFDNLIVDIKEASTSDQNTILAREVGDIIQIELTPPGGGSPAQITSFEIIDQISYSITPDIFNCTYQLSNADVQAFFRLDNNLFGELDTDKLGY